MKTLHLTNAYHPTSGGIRHLYDALLAAAQHAPLQIRLVVPAEETSVEDVNPHARIYRIRAPRAPLFDRRYRMLLPTQSLAPAGPIARILRDEQPDLVEVCDKYSLCHLAGVLRKGWIAGLKRPVLVGLSCERMDDNVASYMGLGAAGQALAALYMRRIYVPQFDYHVANSHYTAGELRRQSRTHPRPVSVLPMGVEVARFRPARRTVIARHRMIRQIHGSERTRVLVYAGRLAVEKNVRLLPRVLKALSRDGEDYRLLIAGGGPQSTSVMEECQRLVPGKGTFLQHLDREALADMLANADVFVHPNPREPFGIGPLEAMASGLAVVAPVTGGVRTYASEDAAWLAPATPELFAARIREIFQEPDVRARKISRALQIAHEYRWEHVAARFFATYDHFVRERKNSRAGDLANE